MTPTRKTTPRKSAGREPSPQEMNMLVALFKQGRYAETETLARTMTVRFPLYGFGWKAVGTALLQQGHIAEALAPLQKATELSQGDAQLHNNLGNTLAKLDRLSEAESSYRQALKLNPSFVEAYHNLGNTFLKLGRLSEAEASYRRVLEFKPDSFEVRSNLGDALHGQGRFPEAEASYRRALELKPDYPEAYGNLGVTLLMQGRLSEAESSYRRALKLKPDFVEAHFNLGSILKGLGRLDEAKASCRLALQINPDCAEAHNNLGAILRAMGRLDEAETSYRRALEIKPDFADAHSNLLFCLSHNENFGVQELFAEHVRFGEQFEAPLRTSWPQHTNSRNPERCLKVGFVSGDFRYHAVAPFIEPILTHLSAYPQLSLHAYANQVIDDSTTQRLRGYFAHWHPIAGLSDAMLAEKIRADGIDILIDLSGHTDKNRLLTFARKPAPLQVSWIGYPGTTGLSAMDYYLADSFRLPAGQFDGQFTEKIVQMPVGAPFLPNKDAPPVNALPALSNGYVTFGSFNRPSKISHAVIALWSQLLHALPNSRMVLGAMPQDEKYDTLVEWFAQEGIARKRLSFYPRTDMNAYLALHQQVDICLNPFPYTGGTTICHALWMGVPTLTLTGQTIPSRGGASILGHVGLEAFIAQDAAGFVRKGLFWVNNLSALANLRAGLRERFEWSAMGQPAIAAAGLERALRIMWQRWCAGLPTESFEV